MKKYEVSTGTRKRVLHYHNYPFLAILTRDGMCDVLVEHGQDEGMRDGPILLHNTTSLLVNGGQIRVL